MCEYKLVVFTFLNVILLIGVAEKAGLLTKVTSSLLPPVASRRTARTAHTIIGYRKRNKHCGCEIQHGA